MDKLYVYADFDWLEAPEPLGVLTRNLLRRSEAFSFEYDKNWLRRHPDITLSADIETYEGQQHTPPGGGIFGCFADAMPDRWGKTLMDKREEILAKEQLRTPRALHSWDYLTGVDDFSRMGALRFKEAPDGDYTGAFNRLRIPPVTSIAELMEASQGLEKSGMKGVTPDTKWILQLMAPGTSLGGARPKANIMDKDGVMKIAKFPKLADNYDAGLWEHFLARLAYNAGIAVPETSVCTVGGLHHVFLTARFDRAPSGGRRHYASAITMLGFADGAGADTGHGYLDIADFIVGGCADVQGNLEELYRRAAFNICTGNADDHFRNHGFLLTPKGWTLSPAFDMNPTLLERQAIMVTRDSNVPDLRLLLEAHEDYLLDRDTAEGIVRQVTAAVKDWRRLATMMGLRRNEKERFESVLDNRAATLDPPSLKTGKKR